MNKPGYDFKKFERFGVHSPSVSLYNAFIADLEDLGIVWNGDFNPKSAAHRYTTEKRNCIYMSPSWQNDNAGILRMSFSSSSDVLFNLGHQYIEAVDEVKRRIEACKSLPMHFAGFAVNNIGRDYLLIGCKTFSIPYGISMCQGLLDLGVTSLMIEGANIEVKDALDVFLAYQHE